MSIFKKIREKRKAITKNLSCPICSAIIVAAGTSSRMNGTDKLFTILDGKPVLAHALLEFEKCSYISEIIVVTSEKNIIKAGNLCKDYSVSKLSRIVCGGNTRTISVQNGLNAISDSANLVLIHDGARPLVNGEIIRSTIHAAVRHSAAAPAIPVTDTIKVIENGFIVDTPDRNRLYAVQTPQVFDVSLIKAAIFDAINNGAEITDDCSAIERLGGIVRIVDGSAENIKITVPTDLIKAEAILNHRKELHK